MDCRVSPFSYTSNTKTISLKPGAYSFAQLLYCKESLTGTISATESFCIWSILQVKVSVGTCK